MFLNGDAIAGRDGTGNRIVDDNFLLYFNGGPDEVELTLPPPEYAADWDIVIDTAADAAETEQLPCRGSRTLARRSVLVLMEHDHASVEPELSAAASVAAMSKAAE